MMKQPLTHVLAFAIGAGSVILWRPQPDRDLAAATEKPLAVKHHAVPDAADPAGRTSVRTTEQRQDLKTELAKPVASSDLDAWLESRKGDARRHAEALVTVGMLTKSPDLIRQGIQADPGNPHLLFIGSTWSGFSADERLEMSKRLHAADPDNALAAYLSAACLSEAGQTEAAVQLMKESSTRPEMNDFRMATLLMTEEAWIATGLSPEAAKIRSSCDSSAGHLMQLHTFVTSLKGLEGSLSPDEAAALRSSTALMGQRLGSQSRFGGIVDLLAGMRMEESALDGMPDDGPSPYAGLTIGEARQSIAAQRDEIRKIMENMPDIDVNDADLMARYIDRVRMLGELEAVKWFQRQQIPQDTR